MRERISQPSKSIRRSVHGDARSLFLWLVWSVEGEPAGTQGYYVRAANEDAIDSFASVVAVLLGEGLHPGRQSHKLWVRIYDRGIRYARDDWACHFAKAGLGEAGEDGGAEGDILEYLADEGGVLHVFEEGIVGAACKGFFAVGDGGLEEW